MTAECAIAAPVCAAGARCQVSDAASKSRSGRSKSASARLSERGDFGGRLARGRRHGAGAGDDCGVGRNGGCDLSRRGRANLRMQSRRRRQARLGVSRADRDLAPRRQDGRPSLRGPDWESVDGSAVVGKALVMRTARRRTKFLDSSSMSSASAVAERSPASRPCSASTRAAAPHREAATRPVIFARFATPPIMFSCAGRLGASGSAMMMMQSGRARRTMALIVQSERGGQSI